jgi:type 1 glutamine amidotransferase
MSLVFMKPSTASGNSHFSCASAVLHTPVCHRFTEAHLVAVDFGAGRVFHTTLGHADYSMECVGFITTFQRGAEWAATGKVTQKVPPDFPGNVKSSSRAFVRKS